LIGIDIVNIADFIERTTPLIGNWVDRMFTNSEQKHAYDRGGIYYMRYLAGIWAMKEAVTKIADTQPIDVEIGYDENGKPLCIKPKTKEYNIHVSCSYTADIVIAVAVRDYGSR